MTKFQPAAKETEGFEHISVSVFSGEKGPLIETLNNTPHSYGSFAQFVRAAINLKLKELGSEYTLTIR